jgi:hypothetical protein
MAARTLKLTNLKNVPFADFIEEQISKHLGPLTSAGVLEIDFTGKTRDAFYELDFDTRSNWKEGLNKHRCWYVPGLLGESQAVFVQAHRRMNLCDNVSVCSTCTPYFRHSKEEVGLAIANTALHELGHQFGFRGKSVFTGADEGGHTGNERNFMFDTTLHTDYSPLLTDTRRTRKYVVKSGDSLSTIAYRIGFRRWWRLGPAWQLLWNFKGQDGTSNRQVLRSGDPHLIFPGEEIWVPDYHARVTWRRAVEVTPKSFTKSQLDTLAEFIREGKQLVE